MTATPCRCAYGNVVPARHLPAVPVHVQLLLLLLNGLVDEDKPVTVKLLGGDLQILWNRQENLVYMTGSATTVFDGEIDVSFLEK
mgnify:CR=1 FL=1